MGAGHALRGMGEIIRNGEGPGPGRRRFLRWAGAATALGGGAVLSACAGSGNAANASSSATARPATSQPVTELTFMPWWIYWTATGRSLVQQQADTFSAAHKGLRLKALPGPQGGGASTSGVIASILAGSGPDVIADCCGAFATYTSQGVFANLTPLLKRDNINIDTWARAQAAALHTQQGQFALPVYNGPVVYACRLDILDTLGLPYPDPQWTYTEAADLWTKCAGQFQAGGKSQHRYGVDFWWQPSSWYAGDFLLYGFGGAEMDPTRTRALVDSPGSLAALEWVYPLIWEKVIGPSQGALHDGTAAFHWEGGWSIPHNVVNYGAKFKWAYYPVPKFPHGRATFNNNDFWGINAQSKHPDQAWEVLKWLTYEDSWQRFCMKTTLLAPCKVALWAEFEQQLIATAPILKGKGLQWFRDAAEGGYGYPQEFFKYQWNQADTLLGQAIAGIYDRKLSISGAMRQAAQRIDALVAAGATIATEARGAKSAFPTHGPQIATVPPGL